MFTTSNTFMPHDIEKNTVRLPLWPWQFKKQKKDKPDPVHQVGSPRYHARWVTGTGPAG